MVSFLRNHRNLTIVTTGIEVALTLSKNTNFTVILLGGIVHPESVSVTGAFGECSLSQLHIKTAFVSCAGISIHNGLTETEIRIADMKRRIVAHADKVVALVESSKFGQVYVSSFAQIKAVAHIFTDDHLPQAIVEEYRRASTTLTLCGQSQSTSYNPETPNGRNVRIGFANISEDRPFAVFVRRGLEQAVQERGQMDLIIGDNQYDHQTAMRVAERLVEAEVDVAIEYHFDEELAISIVEKFRSAKIPVVSIDLPIMGTTYFGVDSYRAGFQGGVYLGNWIRDHWHGRLEAVVIVQNTRSQVGSLRVKGQLDGIESVLGSIPSERIVRLGGDRLMSTDDVTALTLDALASMPDKRHIVFLAFNDNTIEGVVRGVAHAERDRDVACISLGGGTRFIRAELHQRSSCLVAAILFQPESYGKRLVELAARIVNGEPVPPAVYIEHILIDRTNVDKYYPELQHPIFEKS
jgi:ribose transport system substrate-binding protein